MKRLALCGFAFFGMVVGCGNDNGGGAGGAGGGASAEASAAKARFAGGPTASLTTGNGSRALSETKRQQTSGADALKADPLGGGASGSATGASLAIRGLRWLDDADAGAPGPAASTCADIQADQDKGTCACPGGGDLAYDVPNLKALKSAAGALPDEIDIAFTYHACTMDSTSYDGALELVMSKKSVVSTDPSATSAPPAAGGMNMLIVATNLTVGGDKLDFAFAMDGGVFYYAPSVDANGGYVLSELSLTGGTKIHAKNGTFDCTTDDTGSGSCTSESGGDPIPIGATGDADAGAPADGG